MERRQVLDLQPVRAEVTEHQLIERECPCGHRVRAAAPPGAQAPVQYGPRIAAIIVYLYAGQFLSKQRTALALAELFGLPLAAAATHVTVMARVLTITSFSARRAYPLSLFTTICCVRSITAHPRRASHYGHLAVEGSNWIG